MKTTGTLEQQNLGPTWTPVIQLSTDLAFKMRYLVGKMDKECQWFSRITRHQDDETKTIIYELDDIVIPEQEVSGSEVDSPNYGPSLIKELRDRFPDEDEFNEFVSNMNCWAHSHVNMGVTPSNTDEATFKQFVINNEAKKVVIMLIVNKRDEAYVRIFDPHARCIFRNVPIYIPQPDIDVDYINQALKDKIKVRQTVIGTGTSYTGYAGSTYGTPSTPSSSGGTRDGEGTKSTTSSTRLAGATGWYPGAGTGNSDRQSKDSVIYDPDLDEDPAEKKRSSTEPQVKKVAESKNLPSTPSQKAAQTAREMKRSSGALTAPHNGAGKPLNITYYYNHPVLSQLFPQPEITRLHQAFMVLVFGSSLDRNPEETIAEVLSNALATKALHILWCILFASDTYVKRDCRKWFKSDDSEYTGSEVVNDLQQGFRYGKFRYTFTIFEAIIHAHQMYDANTQEELFGILEKWSTYYNTWESGSEYEES